MNARHSWSIFKTTIQLGHALFLGAALAGAAGAQTFVLTADLTGGEEVPPTASTATGTASFTYDPITDVLDCDLTTESIVGTAAHIHTGPAGSNGGVLLALSGGPTTWSGSIALSASGATDLLNEGLYLNVHSASFPGGEIRGQILLHHAGLGVSGLGTGELDVDSGLLRISNLGSSGLDGVSIHLGSSGGGGIKGDEAFMSYFQDSSLGTKLETVINGALTGGVPATIATITGEDVGNERLSVTTDYAALGVSTVTVDVYFDNALVQSFPNVSTTSPIAFIDPDPIATRTPWWIFLGMGINVTLGVVLVLVLCGNLPIFIGASMVPVFGNEIRVTPENPIAMVAGVYDYKLTGEGMSELVITEMTVEQFGLEHQALGMALIEGETSPDKLKVSNIGSSGLDGVSVNFGPASAAELHWQDLPAINLVPTGGFIEVGAIGTLGGLPNAPLGSLRITDVGEGLVASVDYSSTGSTSQTVEIYNAGALVHSSSGHTTTWAQFGFWPQGCKKRDVWGGSQTSCFAGCWESAISISVPGFGSFMGDEFRILADGGVPVNSLESFSVRLKDIDEFIIDNAAATPTADCGTNCGTPYCFGDGSGTTCPCAALGNPGEGCLNTGGVGGATLSGSGDASVSGDSFQLGVAGIPGAKAGLCIKGSNFLGGGGGNPVGDGLLCTSPQIRSQVIVTDSSGNLTMSHWRGQPFSAYPGAANLPGAVTNYQWWYRDPSNSCSGQGFNFSNAWTVTWTP